jgi:hypothetical protein
VEGTPLCLREQVVRPSRWNKFFYGGHSSLVYCISDSEYRSDEEDYGRYRLCSFLIQICPDVVQLFYVLFLNVSAALNQHPARNFSDRGFVQVEGSIRTNVWTKVDDSFVCSAQGSIQMEELPNEDVKLTQPKLLQQLLDDLLSQLGLLVVV